ncbi:MAG: O-antigen ligase family protein [Acidobacteria bacterium]|nr:O-antigen ligase family protein [Acidobacteriota bacterium]
MGLLSLLSFSSLLESMNTFSRFSPFSFHPNLLGFLAGGYFCAMLWKFIASGWRLRVLCGITALICLVVVFFASARGSIAGIVFGCCVVLLLEFMRAQRKQRIRLCWYAGISVGVVLTIIIAFHKSEWMQNSSDFVDRVLELTDNYRGVGTGFTGRFDKWSATLKLLSNGNWLVGQGIRSSDLMPDNLIDNSYLVILYEIGLIPLVLIVWRFVDVTRRVGRLYQESVQDEQRVLYLAYVLLMTTFLVNNIVARYLFSVGNAYSLFCLFLFAAPTCSFADLSHRSANGLMRVQPAT